jgi:hypothetical protein
VARGLNAKVHHPKGKIARDVCRHFFKIAWENSLKEERKYLPLIEKRIQQGNLSEIIRERVSRKSQRTDLREAIVAVYSSLIKSLIDNQPYF